MSENSKKSKNPKNVKKNVGNKSSKTPSTPKKNLKVSVKPNKSSGKKTKTDSTKNSTKKSKKAPATVPTPVIRNVGGSIANLPTNSPEYKQWLDGKTKKNGFIGHAHPAPELDSEHCCGSAIVDDSEIELTQDDIDREETIEEIDEAKTPEDYPWPKNFHPKPVTNSLSDSPSVTADEPGNPCPECLDGCGLCEDNHQDEHAFNQSTFDGAYSNGIPKSNRPQPDRGDTPFDGRSMDAMPRFVDGTPLTEDEQKQLLGLDTTQEFSLTAIFHKVKSWVVARYFP